MCWYTQVEGPHQSIDSQKPGLLFGSLRTYCHEKSLTIQESSYVEWIFCKKISLLRLKAYAKKPTAAKNASNIKMIKFGTLHAARALKIKLLMSTGRT